MWEYFPGDLPRPVTVSKELYEAVHRFSDEKKMSIQSIFQLALSRIWRTWNGGTTALEPASVEAEHRVAQIFIDSAPPGRLNREYRIYIGFDGEKLFDFACELENLYIVRGTEGLIRRSITWFLQEQGYLEGKKQISFEEVESYVQA